MRKILKIGSSQTQWEKKREEFKEKQKKELSDLFIKSGKEGFDNMPWGTDADYVLLLYPNAK